MISPPCNNFLRSLLHFIVVRHDEGLGRLSFRSVFLNLRWQKEEEQKEDSQLCLHECWTSFIGHLFSDLVPSVCLYSHPYCKASYMFGFEILGYSQYGYNLDENHRIFAV
jgi:hypothetical protein